METRFREITTRPGEPAEVRPGEPAEVRPGEPAEVHPGEPAEVHLESDGTVELHWPAEGLTVLLSREEADHLVSELIGASLTSA